MRRPSVDWLLLGFCSQFVGDLFLIHQLGQSAACFRSQDASDTLSDLSATRDLLEDSYPWPVQVVEDLLDSGANSVQLAQAAQHIGNLLSPLVSSDLYAAVYREWKLPDTERAAQNVIVFFHNSSPCWLLKVTYHLVTPTRPMLFVAHLQNAAGSPDYLSTDHEVPVQLILEHLTRCTAPLIRNGWEVGFGSLPSLPPLDPIKRDVSLEMLHAAFGLRETEVALVLGEGHFKATKFFRYDPPDARVPASGAYLRSHFYRLDREVPVPA